MKIIGEPLTDEERAKIRHPFLENKGTNWDIKKVTATINRGAEALENSPNMREIEKGLDLLAGE